ncbi:GNAT family N-acetyltransferase [Catenulispora sp. NF23]|uniref:GNAT family N-acetyltransferase n=1 Tax=Catenulispora pinistramenti TaxID=2705254 RepID=UPI001BA986EE|nr:GNAT family N-acetyltransferase [Catenulispora pinistramenti]MBS2531652.1 GNAT family N-acetyltransferase [Catenulispora pinistramenti]
MPIEISLFDPSSASNADLAAHYRLTTEVMTLDHPDQPLPALEEYVELLREPATAMGPISRWVMREDGHIMAGASAIYPRHENRHMSVVRVVVSPARRRGGAGTMMLRAILPDLGIDGRTLVMANGVKADATGELWARELGFVRTRAHERQMLALADVDPALWERPVPAGFRLERWIGSAPEKLLEEYARARTAILDAPRGDSQLIATDWTAERVRSHEADLRARDVQSVVTVAVRESSGRIVGITEIELWPNQPSQAMQMDTAVVAAFRGHGLGLVIKGAMLRWLRVERPVIAEIFTHTAHDNAHMIRINHALGYTTLAVVAELQIGIAELTERLESL